MSKNFRSRAERKYSARNNNKNLIFSGHSQVWQCLLHIRHGFCRGDQFYLMLEQFAGDSFCEPADLVKLKELSGQMV